MPIYDLSYRRIAGVRHAQGLRFVPIAASGVRQFFRKRINVLGVIVAMAPYLLGVFFLLVPYVFLDLFGGREIPAEFRRFLHVTPDGVYLGLARVSFWFIVGVSIYAGSGAIANDMRSNALEIYFSRPITRLDYVIGKLGTVLGLSLFISLVPLVVLWLLDLSLTSEEGYLASQLPLLPKMIAATLVMSLPYCLLVLALSSLARSQRNVMVVFGALIVAMPVLATVLRRATRDYAYRLIDLRECVSRLAYDVLGVTGFASAAQERSAAAGVMVRIAPQPLREVETWKVALVVAAWVAVCCLILRRRVRGFEVVKG